MGQNWDSENRLLEQISDKYALNYWGHCLQIAIDSLAMTCPHNLNQEFLINDSNKKAIRPNSITPSTFPALERFATSYRSRIVTALKIVSDPNSD